MDEQWTERARDSEDPGRPTPNWGPPVARPSNLPPNAPNRAKSEAAESSFGHNQSGSDSHSASHGDSQSHGPSQVHGHPATAVIDATTASVAAAATADETGPPPPRLGLFPNPAWAPPGAATPPAPAERPRSLPPINPAIVAACVAAAFLINLAIQGRPQSLAGLLAVSVMAALVIARPRPRAGLPILAPVALALLTAVMITVRTSPWITAPAIAVIAASLILAAQDRLLGRSGLTTTVINYLTDIADAVQWLLRPLGRLASRGSGGTQVARGLVLAGLVVVPLTLLLVSADPIFGQVLSSGIEGRFWTNAAITTIVLPAVAALALSARRSDRTDTANPGRPKRGTMTEATIVLTSVAVLLAAWGMTQVVVALGGAERLLATVDLTAAQNARQGFFQLVAVTALLVVVVVGIDRYVDRSTGAERLRFLALTAVIGVETIGVVLATYSRLSLYIQGFGYTMLRTSVAWFLAFLVAVMTVVIVTTNRRSKPTRPLGGPMVMLAGLWVVGFAIFNPEAFVADGNLQRAADGGDSLVGLDVDYLADRLGADAVPPVVELLPTQSPVFRTRLTEALCAQQDHDAGLFGWNRSEARAEAAIDSLGCPRR